MVIYITNSKIFNFKFFRLAEFIVIIGFSNLLIRPKKTLLFKFFTSYISFLLIQKYTYVSIQNNILL